jgi:hypothetical protein
MDNLVLSVTNLTIPNRGQDGQPPRRPGPYALDKISFSVKHGESVLVAGGHGAGKSPLMGCLRHDPSLANVELPFVRYAEGITMVDIDFYWRDFCRFPDLNPNTVLIKDGYGPWDSVQGKWWKRIRDAGATFIFSTEIDKLPTWDRPVDQVLLLAEAAAQCHLAGT